MIGFNSSKVSELGLERYKCVIWIKEISAPITCSTCMFAVSFYSFYCQSFQVRLSLNSYSGFANYSNWKHTFVSVRNKCRPLPSKTSWSAPLAPSVQLAVWTNAFLKPQMWNQYSFLCSFLKRMSFLLCRILEVSRCVCFTGVLWVENCSTAMWNWGYTCRSVWFCF